MKIIDRYLISHFLKPLSVCGIIFSILVLVGHFFDKMGIFTAYHAHVSDMVVYLVLGLPYWLNLTFPIATLLALMFSLGQLQQRGEILAMRSAGVSFARLYAPFLAMGILISLLSLAGGLTLFPSLSSRANILYRRNIKGEQTFNAIKDHIVVTGRDHQRFTIRTLNTQTGAMEDIVIDQFDDQGHLLSTLSAQQALYQNNQWTFNRGNIIHFDGNGTITQEPFQAKVLNIHEKPEDLIFENRKPDDMTHEELEQRIHHLQELGVPSFKEQVALHLQFALPFANVIVILLGIPFAFGSQQKGRVQTIGYALAAAFLYWGAVSVFQSLGEQGHVPAWIAAWAANAIFGTLAIWRLQQTLRF